MSKRMQHRYVGIVPPTSTSCYIHAIRGYNTWYSLLSRLGRTVDREKSKETPHRCEWLVDVEIRCRCVGLAGAIAKRYDGAVRGQKCTVRPAKIQKH